MIVLYRKQNYRNIALSSDNAGNELVGVLRRDGTIEMVRWLGLISQDKAKALPDAKPVKLVISHVVNDRRDTRDLVPGEFVQGCWTPAGVYCVVAERVICV
jgi:hypothetical protein